MNFYPVENHLINFIHYLRDNGFKLGIQETLDSIGSLGNSRSPDEYFTRHLFRALACHDHEDWIRFDRFFTDFWYPEKTNESVIFKNNAETGSRKKITGGIAGIAGASEEYNETIRNQSETMGSGAGRQRSISKADFRFLNDVYAARKVEKLAEQLAFVLYKKSRRKFKYRSHGKRIDIRKTVRSNIKYGGLPVKPVYINQCRELPHLVILHDVSHSMTWNNPLLFRFARGLVKTFPGSEAFAFHTNLFCVTSLYRERSLERMRKLLESRNYLWFGGTCIADSLKYFNDNYAAKMLTHKTLVLIISDGFDSNESTSLELELKKIKRSAKGILWLNPVIGRENFSPDDNFLNMASSCIDLLAPAHSLESLENVVNHITTRFL